MNNLPDKNKIADALKQAGANGKRAADAVQSGKLDSLLSTLSPTDAQKVQDILNDKQATQMILNSPQCKKILQQLFGSDKNG